MNRVVQSLSFAAVACGALIGWVAAPAGAATPAAATCTPTSSGPPSIVVSKTVDLDPNGESVTVTGTGFDECKGVYVAFCVVPPAGQAPSPCGGGVDLTGTNGSSSWISSDPPAYGVGLAVPYGPGGTFTTIVQVEKQLSDTIDCTAVQCAVVTRNDHTRSTDRSQDVIVPVFFAAVTTPTVPPTPAPTEAPQPEPTASPTAAPTVAPTAAPTIAPGTFAPTTAPPVVESATTVTTDTTLAPSTTLATTTTTTTTSAPMTSSSTTTSVVLITSVSEPTDDGASGAQMAWIIGGASAVVALGAAGTFAFLRRQGRL